MGKGRPWCADLPVVNVPPGVPKRVTLIYPFYENPICLAERIAEWHRWPQLDRMFVSAIIVDDGSPEPATLPADLPFPMRLFRIEQDVRWNWLAARNIGAHHAADGWLILTDMDHRIPVDTILAVIVGEHDPNTVYAFSREEHTGEPIGPHSASFLMTREMFWRIGGYDETFSGLYGTDGLYRRRVASVAKLAILPWPLIRYEYVGDSSTTRYRRKQQEDARVSQIARSLPKNHRPKTLSFPYREVTA